MKPEVKQEVSNQSSLNVETENAENSSPNHAKELAKTNKLFQISTLQDVQKNEAPVVPKRRRTNKLSDPVTTEEMQDLNLCLIELLLDNGMDFGVVESSSFIKFCKKMRPTFAPPTQEQLLNEYLKPLCSVSALKSCINMYPILYLQVFVLDGDQAIHILTFVRNDEKFLLVEFKLSTPGTYQTEIPELLISSIIKIREKFSLEMMMCMFNAPETTNINQYLLGKDALITMPDNNLRIDTIRTNLISSSMVVKVVLILEYFQNVDFESLGGLAIPSNLQHLSFQKICEVFRCYVSNIEIMNTKIADQDSNGNRDLSEDVIRISNEHFQFLFLKTTVVTYQTFIQDLDEIEKNLVQKKLSDSVEDWFQLMKKYNYDESLQSLVERVVINNLSAIELSANVLNWNYRGTCFIGDNVSQYFQVLNFLTKIIQTKGKGTSVEKALKILSQYMGNPDSYKEFFTTQIGVQVFWKIIANHSPILQATATDILVLPASMPKIQPPRISFDEPEKILTYYILKLKNLLPSLNADNK